VEATIPQAKRKYIPGVDDEELRQGILDGSIPSTIADSGATSGVGTKVDPSHCTGEPSDKRFILPSGDVIQATEIAEYPFNIRAPANELHITPGVSQHSLLSTGKYADANYITVFDKDTVNVDDANETIITVTKDAILQGWRDTDSKLWRIPLVDVVQNVNTDTIVVNRPPTEFLTDRPPTEEAIHNVYELKTSPELVRYLHAAAGFPTKPQWITAIKISNMHRGRVYQWTQYDDISSSPTRTTKVTEDQQSPRNTRHSTAMTPSSSTVPKTHRCV
jgi:hypothetical protein